MKNNYLFTAVLSFAFSTVFSQNIYEVKTKQMGGATFQYSVEAGNEIEGKKYLKIAQEEIDRIDKLISSKHFESETSKINDKAGISAVKVSKEIIDIIKRSVAVSEMSNGYFDISFASVKKTWNFNDLMGSSPDASSLTTSVEQINFRNIEIDEANSTVFLKEKGMKIGFGAIDKGYAVETVKKKLQDMGVKSGFINAGGDLTCWGAHPKDGKWKTFIGNSESDMNALKFELENASMVTSGNYQSFVSKNGKKYKHIIDPKTGTLLSGIQSVTIVTSDAEMADALATTVYIMGIQKGIELIESMDNVKYLILDDEGVIYSSKGLEFQKG
ncbi:FAD:protein FMN transferase [Aureivirga sp. CE67]|uniref:FAD:protein FMN transferase n=1 Tax=Aureivirga sp. CE67 TaxID=1788983 RepID=UPI0018CA8610|nr:FAD:protein FMN transferase [Aureivirga sp. CE67]